MIVLGIDPGLSGGLALVERGDRPRLLSVIDVPVTGEKAKRRVDAAVVIGFLQQHKIDHAFIERAQAMPEQGSSSGFIYGRAVGALETCVVGLSIPHTIIESVAWKKFAGLIKRGKEDSRQRALSIFPGAAGLERVKDHNRAEAILMAWYGLALLTGRG